VTVDPAARARQKGAAQQQWYPMTNGHFSEDLAEAAKQGPFGERIAHGMLSPGLIFGPPGPGAMDMRRSLRFALPVKVEQGNELVIEGEADMQVPSRN
jgi:hypothetical protein